MLGVVIFPLSLCHKISFPHILRTFCKWFPRGLLACAIIYHQIFVSESAGNETEYRQLILQLLWMTGTGTTRTFPKEQNVSLQNCLSRLDIGPHCSEMKMKTICKASSQNRWQLPSLYGINSLRHAYVPFCKKVTNDLKIYMFRKEILRLLSEYFWSQYLNLYRLISRCWKSKYSLLWK